MANHPTAAPVPRERRKAAGAASISGFFGSTLEYYDFVIFGVAAAMLFGDLFFGGKKYATLLALATFGVAYVARPLGAILWGHLGDRIGRSKVLMLVLLTMGAATFLVGCLPTVHTIGVAAPILLVLLRLIQGVSAGGESSGSALVAMEHAPDNRRGYQSSWTLSGANLGNLIATMAFIPVAAMPHDALYSWGWRIPFWCSALVVLITYLIRSKVQEPEIFEAIDQSERPTAVPIAEVFSKHGKTVLRVALGSLMISVNSLFAVWSLSYATTSAGLPKAKMLTMIALTNLIAIILIPVYALISDKIGRRPIFIVGSIGSIVCTFAYLGSLSTHNWGLIYASAIALMCLFFAPLQAITTVTFLEMFPAHIRYSGMGVGNMLGILAAGFMPTIAQAFTGSTTNWVPVAIVASIFVALSGIAVATGPENAFTPTADLGRAPGVSTATVPPVVVADSAATSTEPTTGTGLGSSSATTPERPGPAAL